MPMSARRFVVSIVAIVALAGCSSDSKSDATKFVSSAKQNARAAANDTSTLLTEVGLLVKGDSSTSANEVAQQAETLHGHLSDFHTDLLGADGASSDDALDFITAEDHLTDGVDAITMWAGNMNATTLAKWSAKVGDAVTEWNAAVKKLWKAAATATPVPVIKTD